MRDSSTKYLVCLFLLFVLALSGISLAAAAAPRKLDKPPLTENWFGIYVDNERVGFYRQIIAETAAGYRMEGSGSVRVNVMGFSRQATTREVYLVDKQLALLSFEVEQNVNGVLSRLSGTLRDSILSIRNESAGKSSPKPIKVKGDIYPGPALNLYPLMRDASAGKSYKIRTFDPEEIKVKEVRISVLGDEKTPAGQSATKLRNNLYPFVSNDIWVDDQGNTLLESVRDGLVLTRAEDPRSLGAFVGNMAISRKDLIYDFSLVRAVPPLREQQKLTGLALEISGWDDALPLLQEGGQEVEKAADGVIRVRTGSAVALSAGKGADCPETALPDSYLKPAEKIESDAPEILAKAKELTTGKESRDEIARALAAWTADWLRDSVDDGGGALESLKGRSGNCQTHARLYTALARAAGIPTRFVSGLVALEGKGFLYHSWAESRLGGRWVAVDPTYNQLPADPTHLKLFEGHTQDEMAPIIAIIGKISIRVLEARYN
jgi:transglutaminase-like putative cysteine protease